MEMHPSVKRILITGEEITKRCKELGKEIRDYYGDESPVVVGLLKGSVMFMSELIRNIPGDLEIDFMDISSYSGTTSTELKINKDVECSLVGRSVLVVEDIIDTGKTLCEVKKLLFNKHVKDVKIVTLLDKPERREIEVAIDWRGFVIPNEFVIGYGLDYNQKYRNLPYVGVIKEEYI